MSELLQYHQTVAIFVASFLVWFVANKLFFKTRPAYRHPVSTSKWIAHTVCAALAATVLLIPWALLVREFLQAIAILIAHSLFLVLIGYGISIVLLLLAILSWTNTVRNDYLIDCGIQSKWSDGRGGMLLSRLAKTIMRVIAFYFKERNEYGERAHARKLAEIEAQKHAAEQLKGLEQKTE